MTSRHLGYERVHLPLYKVADALFHFQGDKGLLHVYSDVVLFSYPISDIDKNRNII